MPHFDPPIQQDDDEIVSKHGVLADVSKIHPYGDRILGKRLVTWEHKGLIHVAAKMKTEEQARVEIVAIGPKVLDAKVGDVAMIGPYRDLELGPYVFFQEADIRVIVEPNGKGETQ